MFINPGKGGTNIDMSNPTSLSGYRLKDDSPGINSGVQIENNGKMDFFRNNIVKELPDIGAFEN